MCVCMCCILNYFQVYCSKEDMDKFKQTVSIIAYVHLLISPVLNKLKELFTCLLIIFLLSYF